MGWFGKETPADPVEVRSDGFGSTPGTGDWGTSSLNPKPLNPKPCQDEIKNLAIKAKEREKMEKMEAGVDLRSALSGPRGLCCLDIYRSYFVHQNSVVDTTCRLRYM